MNKPRLSLAPPIVVTDRELVLGLRTEKDIGTRPFRDASMALFIRRQGPVNIKQEKRRQRLQRKARRGY